LVVWCKTFQPPLYRLPQFLVYQDPSKNPTQKKSERGPGLGKLRTILGFTFNISTTTEDSDFKFGMHLGFAKTREKIPLRRKEAHGPKLEELPKNWDFPFNIYAMAESIDFKFGTQSGWPIKPIIKLYR